MSRKIALVTGGSQGIGKNICLQLAAKDINVILTYQKGKEEASAVAAKIRGAGGKAAILQLSTDNINSFTEFFTKLATILTETFHANHFDYLVNNAGIGLNVAFTATTEEQFDQLMDVNFKGVFFFTQHALGYLNDGGGIINMSSRLAQAVMPGYSAYASMKGAVESLTRYQAKELAARGVRVNSVAPGPVATGFNGGAMHDNPQYNANVKAVTALGRIGVPEDIGGVVAFLCTKEARWITGQRIEVSGGMNL